MERWLDSFAHGLLVKFKTEEGTEETRAATDAEKQAFAESLKKHLEDLGGRHGPEHIATYDYIKGKVRGGGLHNQDAAVITANRPLSDVFAGMPDPAEGESYCFPLDTTVSFKTTKIYLKSEDKEEEPIEDYGVVRASTWIVNHHEQ